MIITIRFIGIPKRKINVQNWTINQSGENESAFPLRLIYSIEQPSKRTKSWNNGTGDMLETKDKGVSETELDDEVKEGI